MAHFSMQARRLALAAAITGAVVAKPPNFVFFITDDQDVLLGGLTAMNVTLSQLQGKGRTFTNALVDTPICCPSRTSTLSGLFGHNLQQQELQDWCGNFTGTARENATWITRLHENGYRTSMSGKYHNSPPQDFVPLGWDDFFSLNNECQYFNNSFNSNGTTVRYGDAPADYMTSLIGNRSMTFLRNAVAAAQPFLAYIAPHASHMPTTPAPWYENATLPSYEAPRTPQYNASGAGKHWIIADQDPLTPELGLGIDDIFRKRHRALLSVDDIVREVIELLEASNQLDNTYFFYTSDHGYNLGTFRLPVEKFHFLEADVHVPFIVRGPNVPENSTSPAIVSNVDIGATILDLAGLPPAATPTDGRSFAAELGLVRASSESSSAFMPPDSAVRGEVSVRDRMLIEFGRWGSGYVVRGPCSVGCGICPPKLSRLLTAPSTTYSGLRIINATSNLAYIEFSPGSRVPAAPASTNWTELYDLAADPWQMTNLAIDPAHAPMVKQLSQELWSIALCKGAACP